MKIDLRPIQESDVPVCRQILASLPEWFGIEAVNREYIAGLLSRPSGVAQVEGVPVGFLSVERHNSASAEVHVMAVDRAHHSAGIGTALLGWAEEWCVSNAIRWLHVKTRGPATPDPSYEKTRRFYLARGFDPLFETLDLWGPQDAALIMVKLIAGDPTRRPSNRGGESQ